MEFCVRVYARVRGLCMGGVGVGAWRVWAWVCV